MKLMKCVNHPLSTQPLAAIVLAVWALTAPAMAAVESNQTNLAIGRMPVLSPLTLPVGSVAADAAATGATQPVSDHAKVGVPLTLADMGIDFSAHVLANFTDVDGDNEGGSFYEWLIDGAVVGTAATFTPTVAHGGQLLSVRVTPKTQTGDPDTGAAVTSNTTVVRSAIVDRFSKPATTALNWGAANTYCQNLGGGYQLPTVDELQQLYREMTVATTTGGNYQVCERYGWPLDSRCGGSTSYYWTSEPNTSGLHWGVNMNGGIAFGTNDTSNGRVTCVR